MNPPGRNASRHRNSWKYETGSGDSESLSQLDISKAGSRMKDIPYNERENNKSMYPSQISSQRSCPNQVSVSLTTLPGEIRTMIIQQLDPFSSACLAVTNSAFYGIHRKVHGTTSLMTRFCGRRCGFRGVRYIPNGCFCSYRDSLYLHSALKGFFRGFKFCLQCNKYKRNEEFDKLEEVLLKLVPGRYWHQEYYWAFRRLEKKGFPCRWGEEDAEAAFRAELDWDTIWPQKLTTEDYRRGTQKVWQAFEGACARCAVPHLCLLTHHFRVYELDSDVCDHAVRLRHKRTAVQDKTGAWSQEGEEVLCQRFEDKDVEGMIKRRSEWVPGHGRFMTIPQLFEWLGI